MATSTDEQSALRAEVSDFHLLDQAVEEVFATMLASSVSLSESAISPSNAPVTLTAVIGLAGTLSGAFTLVVNEATAKRISSIMLGIEAVELNGDVFDAVGEITNILAGAWKSRTPPLHAGCLLTVPTVVTGTSYDVHRKTTTSAWPAAISSPIRPSRSISSASGHTPPYTPAKTKRPSR